MEAFIAIYAKAARNAIAADLTAWKYTVSPCLAAPHY
jgi:hypothetical protein